MIQNYYVALTYLINTLTLLFIATSIVACGGKSTNNEGGSGSESGEGGGETGGSETTPTEETDRNQVIDIEYYDSNKTLAKQEFLLLHQVETTI